MTNGGGPGGHGEVADPPLPDGTGERRRWDYLLDDIPEELGGGFAAGNFLLRDDGVLLCRHGAHWYVDSRHDPATTDAAIADALRARGYALYEPGVVDERGHAVEYRASARTGRGDAG